MKRHRLPPWSLEQYSLRDRTAPSSSLWTGGVIVGNLRLELIVIWEGMHTGMAPADQRAFGLYHVCLAIAWRNLSGERRRWVLSTLALGVAGVLVLFTQEIHQWIEQSTSAGLVYHLEPVVGVDMPASLVASAFGLMVLVNLLGLA